MDSIGDYVYIVIVAIAAISSFARKRKKAAEAESQKRTVQHAPTSTPVQDEEDDWWKETRPVENPVEIPIEKPVWQQIFTNVSVPEQKPDDLRSYETVKDPQELRVKASRLTKVHAEVEEEKRTNNNDAHSHSNEFALNDAHKARQAFVFSEIFNRKYQ